jgi:hypothetical protein
MGHPWVRLSLELKLPDRQMGCIGQSMVPVSRWHSSEDCSAVSDPAVTGATEHSAEDCTSEAAGIGQRTTKRTMSPVARQGRCSCILLATAVPGHQWAAGCMYAGQGTVAAAVAAEVVAVVAAELSILHFARAGIDYIDRGNDWMKAAGIGHLGSKTFCRDGGCGRARPSRGGAT